MPYLKGPNKTSAFARVNSVDNSRRTGRSCQGMVNNETETEEDRTFNIDPDGSPPNLESKNQAKSSFFRLKNEGDKDQMADET